MCACSQMIKSLNTHARLIEHTDRVEPKNYESTTRSQFQKPNHHSGRVPQVYIPVSKHQGEVQCNISSSLLGKRSTSSVLQLRYSLGWSPEAWTAGTDAACGTQGHGSEGKHGRQPFTSRLRQLPLAMRAYLCTILERDKPSWWWPHTCSRESYSNWRWRLRRRQGSRRQVRQPDHVPFRAADVKVARKRTHGPHEAYGPTACLSLVCRDL